MRRREFCKLMGSAGAAAALPFNFQKALAQGIAEPAGFNQLTQTYAQLCATPELERVFYALRGNAVVPEKLDEATWKEPGWGLPDKPPMPTGWWNGVPLQAPVPGLAGQGPFQPTWESLGEYECPEWYQDAKFGIWNHWSPQCVPEDGDWLSRNFFVDY